MELRQLEVSVGTCWTVAAWRRSGWATTGDWAGQWR